MNDAEITTKLANDIVRIFENHENGIVLKVLITLTANLLVGTKEDDQKTVLKFFNATVKELLKMHGTSKTVEKGAKTHDR